MTATDDAHSAAARKVREVTSLGELIDYLTPDVDGSTGRRRGPLVFRGSPNRPRSLLTSLDKLGGTDPPHTKVALEGHLLRSYGRYARPFLGSPNGWELLVSARHHGVPTRLLDWTSSPLVAAHFATLPTDGQCPVIWQLDWRRVHEHFGLPPFALTIADLEGRFGAGPSGAAADDDGLFADQAPFLCVLDPPSFDQRIAAQAGAFTLCSDTRSSLDVFLARQGLADALCEVVIPPPHVALIRDQLDFLGVDERRMFPDLDGVAAAIRRYYR